MQLDVSTVLRRIKHLGLEIRPGGNHWKVYHPQSGAWLFDVSKSPSDHNWHYNIIRHLKRVGLNFHAPRTKRKGGHKRHHTAVDLPALKLAQDKAAAAGERIPQLSDLDYAPPTSPLWKRDSRGILVFKAESEVIDNMAIRAEAARVSYVRGRLRNFMDEKRDELNRIARERFPNTRPGTGAVAEFVRIAMNDVAPARGGMKAWKNEASGQQAVGSFLRKDEYGIAVWALKLIEATMDHINGLKWGIEVAVAENHAEVETEEMEDELVTLHPEETPVEVSAMNGLRERYADVLLKILAAGTYQDENTLNKILTRLDQLILGSTE